MATPNRCADGAGHFSIDNAASAVAPGVGRDPDVTLSNAMSDKTIATMKGLKGSPLSWVTRPDGITPVAQESIAIDNIMKRCTETRDSIGICHRAIVQLMENSSLILDSVLVEEVNSRVSRADSAL